MSRQVVVRLQHLYGHILPKQRGPPTPGLRRCDAGVRRCDAGLARRAATTHRNLLDGVTIRVVSMNAHTLSSQTPSDGSERDSTMLPVAETQQALHAAHSASTSTGQ